jgi:hypothetical protein
VPAAKKAASDVPEATERPPKDRFFEPSRVPRTAAAKAIVADVLNQLQRYEGYFGLRKRARRPHDQKTFEATVTALIADLMHAALSGADGIVVSRSKRHLSRASRYRPPAHSKMLPTIIDRLCSLEMDFVRQRLGQRNPFLGNKRTKVWASERLLERMHDHGITLPDLTSRKDRALIVLKADKEGHWDKGKRVEFGDTPTTDRFREEMLVINAWLAEADLDFDESVLESEKIVDLHDRQLRRVFTRGSFESGGRLFGGFWQGLKRTERLEGLLIDEERVASLDYGQLTPRIVYGLAKAHPPDGDLYAVNGLALFREGVKKLFNAALFTTEPLSRKPQGTSRLLPTNYSVQELLTKIKATHPAIAPYFETGIGHRTQFIESEVLVSVLLRLRDQGIVGLPVHDAVVVPRSSSDVVRTIMKGAFFEKVGVETTVSIEDD